MKMCGTNNKVSHWRNLRNLGRTGLIKFTGRLGYMDKYNFWEYKCYGVIEDRTENTHTKK
jgi:hypothetical protein